MAQPDAAALSSRLASSKEASSMPRMTLGTTKKAYSPAHFRPREDRKRARCGRKCGATTRNISRTPSPPRPSRAFPPRARAMPAPQI